MPKPLRVFISSTSEDLKDYRAVARNVVLDLQWQPVMMEHFGASTQTILDECRNRIDSCELVILLVAQRRGWVPSSGEGGDGVRSVTAWELQFARDHVPAVPVLAFLATDRWPGLLWEDQQPAREWVKHFRATLNLPAVFFEHEETVSAEHERLPAFRAKLKEALVAFQQQRDEADRGRLSSLDYFNSAQDGIIEGTAIPFVGAGVFGGGPLGSQMLAEALSNGTETSLATAAEYLERYLGSRERFLQHLRRVLDTQTLNAPDSRVHEMLLAARRPPLIVSASFDVSLERCLKAAAKPHVSISHIVRSFDRKHDGRILVLRPGEKPQICVADKVELRKDEYVIYKPLGSPFLHDELDPDDEIDTVVVTETDHLTFLGRLENQHTQIPAAFSRPFQRRPLLFLGYALDVWHYRLLTQVFQAVGARGAQAATLAVRKPASPMEELAWQRLGASLIPMESQEFAPRVLNQLAQVTP
jgi:hypothetical protein